ncbi:hypothetical protein HDU67_006034 [Dinochytrium kinnereticum]|nr:hypothetical protein HDU67_006034 [Dinochytrium kinnereticum]
MPTTRSDAPSSFLINGDTGSTHSSQQPLIHQDISPDIAASTMGGSIHDGVATPQQQPQQQPPRTLIQRILLNLKKPNTYLGFLELAPGTTSLNFTAYLIATFFNICLFVFLNSSQTFVLTQILRVPTEIIGDTSGNIAFIDQILSLVAVWGWGLASDLVGRRTVYVAGYGLMGLAICFYTFARNVYPQLLLMRLVFAVGGAGASSMLTAVLADFAADKDRGKSSGLVGLTSGLGALLALFVFLPLPTRFKDVIRGLRTTYLLVAGLAIAFAVFLFFALRVKSPVPPPPIAPQASTIPADDETTEEGEAAMKEKKKGTFKTVVGLAWEGVMAARNPRILLGYIGASLARGDTVIITIFLPLWVYKSYIDSGRCEAPSPDTPEIRDICRAAYLRASTLSGVTQTFALIGAPFFGERPVPSLYWFENPGVFG